MEVDNLNDPEAFFADSRRTPKAASGATGSSGGVPRGNAKVHDDGGTHDYTGISNDLNPKSPFMHFMVSSMLAPFNYFFPNQTPNATPLSDYAYTFPSRQMSPSNLCSHLVSSWIVVAYWSASSVCNYVYSCQPESMQQTREEFENQLRTCAVILGVITVLGIFTSIFMGFGFITYLFSYYMLLPPAPSTVPLHFDYTHSNPQGIVFLSPLSALESQLMYNSVFSRSSPPPHCLMQPFTPPGETMGDKDNLNYMYEKERRKQVQANQRSVECINYMQSNLAPPHSRSPVTSLLTSSVHNYDVLLHLTVPEFPYFSPFARPYAAQSLHEASVLTTHASLLYFNTRDTTVNVLTDTSFTFSPFAPIQSHPTSLRSLDSGNSFEDYSSALTNVDEGLLACAAKGCYDDRFEQPNTLMRVFAWLVYNVYTCIPARLIRYHLSWWSSVYQFVTAPFTIISTILKYTLTYFHVTQDVKTHTFPLLVNLPADIQAQALAISVVGPHSKDQNILDARISVIARVTGIRWLMLYWPITSCFVGSVIYAILWALLAMYLLYHYYVKHEQYANDYIEMIFSTRYDDKPVGTIGIDNDDMEISSQKNDQEDEGEVDWERRSKTYTRNPYKLPTDPENQDAIYRDEEVEEKSITVDGTEVEKFLPPCENKTPRNRLHKSKPEPNLLTFSSLLEDPQNSSSNLWQRFSQVTTTKKAKLD